MPYRKGDPEWEWNKEEGILAGLKEAGAQGTWHTNIPNSPACIKYRNKQNTYEFYCNCNLGATCTHIEEVKGRRLDAPMYWEPELWSNERYPGNPYLGVPLLAGPEVTYWVELERIPDMEDQFVLVNHAHSKWSPEYAFGKNIIECIANAQINRLPGNTELCMLSRGDGVGDIVSSIFDAFSAYHRQNNPVYACKSKWHKEKQEREMQLLLADQKQKGLELARLFFTNFCTPCSQPAEELEIEDDLIPKGFQAHPTSGRYTANLTPGAGATAPAISRATSTEVSPGGSTGKWYTSDPTPRRNKEATDHYLAERAAAQAKLMERRK